MSISQTLLCIKGRFAELFPKVSVLYITIFFILSYCISSVSPLLSAHCLSPHVRAMEHIIF